MNCYKKKIGDLGEDIARNYLIDIGYEILEMNYRCKTGEIDIIGKDGEFISFIEVKTRKKDKFASPRESVNYIKQHKINKTAQMYILKQKLYNFNFRFDVVEVLLDGINNAPRITLIKDAFR